MALTDKEKFDIARELIRHEDGLVNNRTTWLLVFQGFLFAAFINGLGLFEKFDGNPAALCGIAVGLCLIGVLGIVAAVSAYFSIKAAFAQLKSVKEWWTSCSVQDSFPPVSGALGVPPGSRELSTADVLILVVGVWVIALTLLIWVIASS